MAGAPTDREAPQRDDMVNLSAVSLPDWLPDGCPTGSRLVARLVPPAATAPLRCIPPTSNGEDARLQPARPARRPVLQPGFTEFLGGELKSERERRATLDQRGITVITSSSTLVTLLSGLAALSPLKRESKARGRHHRDIRTCALSFVLAGFFGVLANRSRSYAVASEQSSLAAWR